MNAERTVEALGEPPPLEDAGLVEEARRNGADLHPCVVTSCSRRNYYWPRAGSNRPG
jgi:hypothetical protein